MTPESLHHAFQTAAAIHALGNHLLTLVATGSDDYAATFDPIDPDDYYDWHEDYRIARYPHSARSADPAQAVMEAAVKLIEDLQLPVSV